MNKDELRYVLSLQKVPNIGDINAKKLIAVCGGSARAVFEEKKSRLTRIEGIGSYTVKELHNPAYLRDAEREMQFMGDNNIEYAFFTDPHYPERLKHCLDGPILLFYKGNIKLNQLKCISIVGTRQITTYGKTICEEFIENLSFFNPTIVSGFAYGTDILAHTKALQYGLQTIGCLAHGLNRIYPRAHKRYVAQVLENGGFVTDFWSDSNPDRENFLKRNRIIAGMSEATIVIESAERGGSLVTASIANSYDREVFAVPGRSNDKFSEGCNDLIKKQQAHLITSAADLVYMLGWELEEKSIQPVQKRLFVELDGPEKEIYTYLHQKGKKLLDVIALECHIPVHTVTSLLLAMELKGLIRPLPGKLFEAI